MDAKTPDAQTPGEQTPGATPQPAHEVKRQALLDAVRDLRPWELERLREVRIRLERPGERTLLDITFEGQAGGMIRAVSRCHRFRADALAFSIGAPAPTFLRNTEIE